MWNFFIGVNIFFLKLSLLSTFCFFQGRGRKKVTKKLGGMGKNV